MLQLAEALEVDPHWLATGVASSDSEELIRTYIRVLNEEQRQAILRIIHTWVRARPEE